MNYIRSNFSRFLGGVFVFSLYAFLYTPIIVLIIFSFNDARFPSPWVGFTIDWYRELFEDYYLWRALRNSLVVAVFSVFLSLVMSTLLLFYAIQKKKIYKLLSQFYLNLLFPEIVLAVGLLGFFMFFSVPLGATSLIIAHTILGLGYVIPVIFSRYSEIDYRLTEAAEDLGASGRQIFMTVTVPLLKTALLASAILVFIISFDDFVFAYFCAGSSFITLPLYILSMLRVGISPEVNALSALLILFSSLMVIIYSSFKSRTRMF